MHKAVRWTLLFSLIAISFAVAWDFTLADVAAQVHDAASYRAAVTAWAARAVAQWPAAP